jgi:mannose-6-phosphate isomerase-like protein (cupin superfamily)
MNIPQDTRFWNPLTSVSESNSKAGFGRFGPVEIRSLEAAEPFTTADGSTIRELLGLPTAAVRNQSLAEATLGPGQATEPHYHREAEEIYFLLDGTGEMEVGGERRTVSTGDAILIPPGAWHQIRATADHPLRFLCCCSPPYRHEDTFFR